MTSGSRTRRAAGGVAALTIAALAGCHGGVDVARVATAPNRPQSVLVNAGRATLLPATVALDTPSEMSSIEPSAASAGMTEPAPRQAAPAPTPLLDAALVSSRAITDVVVDQMASPPELPAIKKGPAARPAVVEPPEPPKVATPDPVPPQALRPEEVWRDEIQRLAGLARARRERPGGDLGLWNLRASVLDWLAGPEIDPDPVLDHREPDGVRAVLRVLDDPATPSRTRGDDLRAAVQVLEDKAPLELTELRICSRVERFGDYEPFEPPVRKAGQSLVAYAEVDGLRHESTSAGFRTRLSGQVEIVTEDGGSLVLARPYGPAEEVCRQRRRDYFVPYKLVLPRTIPPGNYRLRLIVKDLLADRSTSREVGFAIVRD